MKKGILLAVMLGMLLVTGYGVNALAQRSGQPAYGPGPYAGWHCPWMGCGYGPHHGAWHGGPRYWSNGAPNGWRCPWWGQGSGSQQGPENNPSAPRSNSANPPATPTP